MSTVSRWWWFVGFVFAAAFFALGALVGRISG